MFTILAALILFTSFVFLTQQRIHGMLNTFAWQSGLLAIATAYKAYTTHAIELYISAGIILILKVIFVPLFMRYVVKKLNIRHKVSFVKYPFLLLMLAVVIVLLCYHLFHNVTSIAVAVMLLGMLLLITHRKAISNVIGFMTMENGIFFAALLSTFGMPMMVELGVAFDVLVATILFGVIFFHLRKSIDSLDVDRLNLLREDV